MDDMSTSITQVTHQQTDQWGRGVAEAFPATIDVIVQHIVALIHPLPENPST